MGGGVLGGICMEIMTRNKILTCGSYGGNVERLEFGGGGWADVFVVWMSVWGGFLFVVVIVFEC